MLDPGTSRWRLGQAAQLMTLLSQPHPRRPLHLKLLPHRASSSKARNPSLSAIRSSHMTCHALTDDTGPVELVGKQLVASNAPCYARGRGREFGRIRKFLIRRNPRLQSAWACAVHGTRSGPATAAGVFAAPQEREKARDGADEMLHSFRLNPLSTGSTNT